MDHLVVFIGLTITFMVSKYDYDSPQMKHLKMVEAGARSLPAAMLELPAGGAKMAKILSFRTSFYQLVSDKNQTSPLAGG